MVLVLISSGKCEKWTQPLSTTSPETCYDTLTLCNAGCTGWRFTSGICASGPSCLPGEDCYSTQEGCMGNNLKGYRCAENCREGAVCGPGDNWNTCHSSQQNCLDSCTGYICSTSASGCTTGAKCTSGGIGITCWTNCPSSMCVGYRYINGVCTTGAKCSSTESNCFSTEDACKDSNIRYKSLGSRCFNSGYNCSAPIGVGSPVKYTFYPNPIDTSGLLVIQSSDNLTVYGTIVSIDYNANTAKIMPDVIQSNGPSSAVLPGGTYYWGRNTWYAKTRDSYFIPRYFGTYGTPSISNSVLPTDSQLTKLANAPLNELTLSNIPDVLL